MLTKWRRTHHHFSRHINSEDEAIGSRPGLPAVSIPADVLMVPGYFGFLANIVTQSYPASNLITRRTLGWEPAQPSLLADLDHGHYFSAR